MVSGKLVVTIARQGVNEHELARNLGEAVRNVDWMTIAGILSMGAEPTISMPSSGIRFAIELDPPPREIAALPEVEICPSCGDRTAIKIEGCLSCYQCGWAEC